MGRFATKPTRRFDSPPYRWFSGTVPMAVAALGVVFFCPHGPFAAESGRQDAGEPAVFFDIPA